MSRIADPRFLARCNPARGLYGAPMAVHQKVSAPNTWVPLWLCPNGCAPKSQCPKCLGAPMTVPQTTVPLRLCPNCRAPRSGFRWNARSDKHFCQLFPKY